MKIGAYSIYSIETSIFGLDGGAMFGIIPKPLWEKKAPADENNRIKMVTRSLLLVSGKRKIIVDTGNGEKWNERFRDIYAIDSKTVNLKKSLKKHDILVEDITDVFCTHLHFDHIGGNTCFEGKKLFPLSQMLNIGFKKKIGIWQTLPLKKTREVLWRRTG